MIRFINVYKGSLSVPYTSIEKAQEKASPNAITRVLHISESGKIEDITEVYEEILDDLKV